MKSLLLLITVNLNIYAFSQNALEGKKLYMDNNCQKCHYSGENYDPKSYKTKTLKDLNGWVSSCAQHFKIAWFPEEEIQVSTYLNESFYELEE